MRDLIKKIRRRLGRLVYGRFEFNNQIAVREEKDIDAIRRKLNRQISVLAENRVIYGPFKGLLFSGFDGWNASDRAAMLLGFYELEVLEVLEEFCSARKGAWRLLNIGAGDGYYCIGALRRGLFCEAVGFEKSEEQRNSIQALALLNGVDSRLTVFGEAESNFIEIIRETRPEFIIDYETLVIIDIEGGEFELLSEEVFKKLAQSTVVIEIHRWADPDGSRIEALKKRVPENVDVSSLLTGSRSPNCPELQNFTDDQRWILCSERRKMPGLWWILRPKVTRIT